MNGIQKNAILNVCQELAISPNTPSTSPAGNQPAKPQTNFLPQQGGSHRIKPGETIAGLAELYGYTEMRFRAFNGLSSTEPAWPGLMLKTSDCNCGDPQMDDSPVLVQAPVEGDPPTTNPNEPLPSYPSWKEAIADSEGPGANDLGYAFGEDPFTGSTPMALDKTDGRIENTTSYSKEVEKITAPNSPKATDEKAKPTLSPEVRRSESGEGAPDKTILSPEEELIRQANKQAPTTNSPNAPSQPNMPSSSKDASFMSDDENQMVKEINLMRSLPSGYVKLVEEYKKRVAAGRAFGSVEACDELIAELKKTPPLSILSPLECVFDAAKKHGMEQFAMGTGTIDHIGKNGSYPSDRVKQACPDLVFGGENLASDVGNVRDVVMMLLVDAGIEGRGHRKTLLDPTWKYVACYKVKGPVGRYPNYWIQNFGK